LVLDYGNPQSLEILRGARVGNRRCLVEPVQSRRLDLQTSGIHAKSCAR